jgi:hypothetical protein
MGGVGMTVEADETYIGKLTGVPKASAVLPIKTPLSRLSSVEALPVPST